MNRKIKMVFAAAAMIALAGCDEDRFNTGNSPFFSPHQQYGGAQNHPGQAGGAGGPQGTTNGQQGGSSGMTGSAGSGSMYTPPPLYGQAQPGQQQTPMTPDAPRPLAESGFRGDSDGGGASAVAYAGRLKDKCIELQNDLIKAQKEKQDMDEKIRALQLENVALQNRAVQAEKELKEANDAAMGVKKDLDAWKRDVLDYRDELRKGLQANVDAYHYIIKLLGGDETRMQAKPAQQTGPAAAAQPAADASAARSAGGDHK
ncbi:MAG: hypothetical protein HZA50_11465 [Planctomycetes bacterium]|nr:hypothetical protein [Planctomycetota bacterium]